MPKTSSTIDYKAVFYITYLKYCM